ncbi:MAG: CopG family transcriptional regulator [Desulfosarcina sp.]|nr:CopG family transcriptional regulator [Desulfosarcina sp.]
MKTVTVKVPEDLDQRLTNVAEKTGESKSNLIRAAIEYVLSMRDNITPNSCLDLAKDLSGSIDGPTDLSFSKKHLEGYGN